MKVPIVLFSFFILFSCSSSGLETEAGRQENGVSLLESQLNDSIEAKFQAPFILDSAYIREASLWVTVSYSGGCEEHDFLIVWPEVIAMVYPPNFGVTVHHKNHSDHCEALISEIIKVDLKDTPAGDFNPETISKMRITVVNGSRPEEVKSTR